MCCQILEDKSLTFFLIFRISLILTTTSLLYIGSVAGQLIYHRTVWFSQKNVTLFNGADSPVTTIAWKGNIVAWADSCQVRIMDLATQSAICFLNCPIGVGIFSPLPCCLFWESECDLLIGWADSFRHVELSSSSGNGPGIGGVENEIITARSVIDWETDCIICGISSFDTDHVVLLGYAPPLESDLGLNIEECSLGLNIEECSFEKENVLHAYDNNKEKKAINENNGDNTKNVGNDQNNSNDKNDSNNKNGQNNEIVAKELKTKLKIKTNLPHTSLESDPGSGPGCTIEKTTTTVITLNQPEIQIIKRTTGELVSVDLLALNQESERMSGPRSFQLLSTYSCNTHTRDASKWKLSDVREKCPRGGLRGLSPNLFIITPQDFITVRVRDVNDYIQKSLSENDLKSAVDYAQKDRLSLKSYRYADLISLYIDDLLDKSREKNLYGYHNINNNTSNNNSNINNISNNSGNISSNNNNNISNNNNNNNSNHSSINNNNNNNTPHTTSNTYKNSYLNALQSKPLPSLDYASLAAYETNRLIGEDAVMWERWIYAFAKRRCLHYISPYIPTSNPRLPVTVYEVRTCVRAFILMKRYGNFSCEIEVFFELLPSFI